MTQPKMTPIGIEYQLDAVRSAVFVPPMFKEFGNANPRGPGGIKNFRKISQQEADNLTMADIHDSCVFDINDNSVENTLSNAWEPALTRGQSIIDYKTQNASSWDMDSVMNGSHFLNHAFFPVCHQLSAGGRQQMRTSIYIVCYSSFALQAMVQNEFGFDVEYKEYNIVPRVSQEEMRKVYVSTALTSGTDALLSILTALANTRPIPNSFITIFPWVTQSVYASYIQDIGKKAWRFSGASFGIATMMAVMGSAPIAYTGFVANAGDNMVIEAQKSQDILQSRRFVAEYAPKAYTLVEVVECLDYKSAWSAQYRFPMIIPALSSLRQPLYGLFKRYPDRKIISRDGPGGSVIEDSRPASIRFESHPLLYKYAKMIYTNTDLEMGINFSDEPTPWGMSGDIIGTVVLAGNMYSYFVNANNNWKSFNNRFQKQKAYARVLQGYGIEGADPETLGDDTLDPELHKHAQNKLSKRYEPRLPPATQEERVYMEVGRAKLKMERAAENQNQELIKSAERLRRIQQNVKVPRGPTRSEVGLVEFTRPMQVDLNDPADIRRPITEKARSAMPTGVMDSRADKALKMKIYPGIRANWAIARRLGILKDQGRLGPGKFLSQQNRVLAIQDLLANPGNESDIAAVRAVYDQNGQKRTDAQGLQEQQQLQQQYTQEYESNPASLSKNVSAPVGVRQPLGKSGFEIKQLPAAQSAASQIVDRSLIKKRELVNPTVIKHAYDGDLSEYPIQYRYVPSNMAARKALANPNSSQQKSFQPASSGVVNFNPVTAISQQANDDENQEVQTTNEGSQARAKSKLTKSGDRFVRTKAPELYTDAEGIQHKSTIGSIGAKTSQSQNLSAATRRRKQQATEEADQRRAERLKKSRTEAEDYSGMAADFDAI